MLDTIYVCRHGFRGTWTVDVATGVYSSHVAPPLGIAGDPALTAYGVEQATQLAIHLQTVDPPVERVYSSPFYRCLQTIQPAVERLNASLPLGREEAKISIRPAPGLSEWFGVAHFDHPTSASIDQLQQVFPALDPRLGPGERPLQQGETIPELYRRVALTLRQLIEECDRDGVRAVVLCSHAAVVIILGRLLTRTIPEDFRNSDFHAHTCGLSVFRRRSLGIAHEQFASPGLGAPQPRAIVPEQYQVNGKWTCELDSDCQFLKNGAERGWQFSDEEVFVKPPNAESGAKL